MLSQLTLRLPQRDGHFVRPLRGAPARQRELPTRCAARPCAQARGLLCCLRVLPPSSFFFACLQRRPCSPTWRCTGATRLAGMLRLRPRPRPRPRLRSGSQWAVKSVRVCRSAPWSQHCALACSYRHFGRIKDAQEAYTKVRHARCSRSRSTIRYTSIR